MIEAGADQDEINALQSIEERRRYVRHNRIDRHSGAGKQAKRAHGYVCQVCGFDFAAVYGEVGEKYIEAHHLIPLSSLPEGQPVPMDPKKDFAVLCANCHRMVHRKKEPLALEVADDSRHGGLEGLLVGLFALPLAETKMLLVVLHLVQDISDDNIHPVGSREAIGVEGAVPGWRVVALRVLDRVLCRRLIHLIPPTT